MKDVEKYQVLLDTVRYQLKNVIWTHKIQEKQADIYARLYKIFEWISIIITALTTCGIVGVIVQDSFALKVATALCSFGAVLISILIKSFDYKELSFSNKRTAVQILAIREELIRLIVQIRLMDKSTEELDGLLTDINDRLNKIYENAPNTTNMAVKLARKDLGLNKNSSLSEQELDCLLPPSLGGRLPGA